MVHLETKHNDYIITIEDEDAAVTEDQWICDMEKNYFDIRVKYSSFVTDLKQKSEINNEFTLIKVIEDKLF